MIFFWLKSLPFHALHPVRTFTKRFGSGNCCEVSNFAKCLHQKQKAWGKTGNQRLRRWSRLHGENGSEIFTYRLFFLFRSEDFKNGQRVTLDPVCYWCYLSKKTFFSFNFAVWILFVFFFCTLISWSFPENIEKNLSTFLFCPTIRLALVANNVMHMSKNVNPPAHFRDPTFHEKNVCRVKKSKKAQGKVNYHTYLELSMKKLTQKNNSMERKQ